ncbi:hypothetical protein AGMMS49991_12070 [Spirochaetia bacterium]|nr:hypothetical protein AGMMS49991_12070 [Spirochaetia bacterium]
MAEMTEEEADALDELLTRTMPKLTDVPGFFARKSVKMVALDDFSSDYLLSCSLETHKTPTEIIGELVREKIAASA